MKNLWQLLVQLEALGVFEEIEKAKHMGPGGGGGIEGVGTSKITVSDSEPSNPQTGDLWIDTSGA